MDLDTVAFNDWMPFLFVATTMWAPEPRSMLGVNASSHWHCDGDLFLFLPRWGSRDFLFVSRIKLPAQIVFFCFVVSIYSLLFAAMTGCDTLFCALSLCLFLSLFSAASTSHTLDALHLFIFIYLLFQFFFHSPNGSIMCFQMSPSSLVLRARRYGNKILQYTQRTSGVVVVVVTAHKHAHTRAPIFVYICTLPTRNRKEYYGKWCLLNWMFGCCLRASCVRFVSLLLFHA